MFSYQILPDLVFQNNTGYNSIQVYEVQTNPLSAVRPEFRPFSKRYGVYGNKRISSWITEPQLIYKRNIGKGKLDFLFGATIQRNYNGGELIAGSGQNSDHVLKDINSAAFFKCFFILFNNI